MAATAGPLACKAKLEEVLTRASTRLQSLLAAQLERLQSEYEAVRAAHYPCVGGTYLGVAAPGSFGQPILMPSSPPAGTSLLAPSPRLPKRCVDHLCHNHAAEASSLHETHCCGARRRVVNAKDVLNAPRPPPTFAGHRCIRSHRGSRFCTPCGSCPCRGACWQGPQAQDGRQGECAQWWCLGASKVGVLKLLSASASLALTRLAPSHPRPLSPRAGGRQWQRWRSSGGGCGCRAAQQRRQRRRGGRLEAHQAAARRGGARRCAPR